MSKIFFNGRLLTTPTTASQVNDDAMQSQNLGTSNAAAFVGESQGGEPGVILKFSNPADAKAVLRGGNLLEAVLKGFAPSSDTNAPGTIFCIRAGGATPSTHMVKDVDDKDLIKLSSINFGTRDNQIRSRLEKGTKSGYRFTVQMNNNYLSSDNISRTLLTLGTDGDDDLAVVVTDDKLTISPTAENAEPLITVDFSDSLTVSQAADLINSVPPLKATVGRGSDNLYMKSQADSVTAGVIKKEEPFAVTANLTELIRWINTNAMTLIKAELADGVTLLKAPALYPVTFFTGGTITPPTVADYSDALDLLQTRLVKWIAVLSGEPSIPAMLSAHVTYCSETLGKERRGIAGTNVGTTDEAASQLARSIQDDRISLVHLGYYDYDITGALVLMPPYLSAAMVASMFAGVTPGTPLTNKSFSCYGLERTLILPSDTDDLIDSGVLCLAADDDGVYKIVQSISTWTADAKFTRTEQSCGAALDATVEAVRKAVDILRGSRNDQLNPSRAVSIAQTTLKECAKEAPIGPGYIVGDAASPPYRNISSSVVGDVIRLQFECSPVIPANFVLVTVFASPYSGTATSVSITQ